MTVLLFAANRCYPKGGLDDFVDSAQGFTDACIFERLIREVGFDRRFDLDQIHAHTVELKDNQLEKPSYYQLLFVESLKDPGLKFASLARYVDRLSRACGLIPLRREWYTGADGQMNFAEFYSLDPSNTAICP